MQDSSKPIWVTKPGEKEISPDRCVEINQSGIRIFLIKKTLWLVFL